MAAAAWDVISLACAPFGAALAVYKMAAIFKHSQRLNEAILEWLTNSNPRSTVHSQYLLIRKQLFGDKFTSWRRSTAIIIVFCMVLCFLVVSYLFTPDHTVDFFSVAVLRYMMLYSYAWINFPVTSTFILIIAFIISHVSFIIFDYITLRVYSFGNSLSLYLGLILISYLIIGTITIFLACFTPYVLLPSTIPDNFHDLIASSLTRIPDTIAEIQKPRNPDDYGDMVARFTLTGILGTGAMCFAAVFISTVFNLVYAFALGVLKADYILRSQYVWNQDQILKEPVEYISAAMSIIVFIIFMLGSVAYGLIFLVSD